MPNIIMAEAFEEREEEKRAEMKKKKVMKPEVKPLASKGPEAIRTLMEIHEIRDTAKKGREILARKKAEWQEPKEEEKDSLSEEFDIKSMLEPPAPPEPPKEPLGHKESEMRHFHKSGSEKLEPLDIFASKSKTQKHSMEKVGIESEAVKKNKSKFEEMMQKMKKFLK